MGFKKPINMEQSIYSMFGFTGNKGCSEGQKGSGMKTVVFQERTEFGYMHLLLILPSLQANPHAHPKDAAVQDFLENFSSSTLKVQRFETGGLGVVSKHPSPSEGCGDLLPALLQAPPSPHVHLPSYMPNPWGFGYPGAGLASGGGSAAAAGVTQAPF